MNQYGIESISEISIHPSAQKWYDGDTQPAIDSAMEIIHEWDYDLDPHGYCHDRPMLYALVSEIERLRKLTETCPTGTSPTGSDHG